MVLDFFLQMWKKKFRTSTERIVGSVSKVSKENQYASLVVQESNIERKYLDNGNYARYQYNTNNVVRIITNIIITIVIISYNHY